MSPKGQVVAASTGQDAGMRPAHSAVRRPPSSWPAALLPGALLLTLLTTAAGQAASGSETPAIDLHVVDAPLQER